jgi:hypothetical protein
MRVATVTGPIKQEILFGNLTIGDFFVVSNVLHRKTASALSTSNAVQMATGHEASFMERSSVTVVEAVTITWR